MTKEVEDIIKNKTYVELTANERERVGEYAQGEEEYNNLKWFLTGATTAFASDKIKASPELKKSVMQHLTESKKKKGFWLNSVSIFMLPEGKKFYQKPAFQLGIAAALVVGFLFFFNTDLEDKGLALNEEQPIIADSIGMMSSEIEIEEEGALEAEALVDEKPIAPKTDRLENLAEEIKEREDLRSREVDLSKDEAYFVQTEKVEDVPELRDEIIMKPPKIEKFEEVEDIEGFEEPDMDLTTTYEEEATITTLNNQGTTERGYEFKMDSGVATNDQTNSALFLNESDKDSENRGRYKKEKQSFVEVQSAETVNYTSTSGEPVVTSLGGTTTKEWILPKSMHINQTKELNQLFHIEK